MPANNQSRLPFFRVWALFLSGAAPLLVIVLYLEYSRGQGSFSGSLDTVAFVVAFVLGAAFLFCTPMKLPARIIALFVYTFIVGGMIVLFSVSYVCARFGACF